MAMALIASGGVGNLWDRFARGGSVVDFLNLGVGPVRTGILNIADLAIVAGAVFLALSDRTSARPAPATSGDDGRGET
jgi:signal peptidase II